MKHFVKLTLNDNNSLDKIILAELKDNKAGDIKRLALEAIMLRQILGNLQIPASLPAPQMPSLTCKKTENNPQSGRRFTSKEDRRINEKLKKMAL